MQRHHSGPSSRRTSSATALLATIVLAATSSTVLPASPVAAAHADPRGQAAPLVTGYVLDGAPDRLVHDNASGLDELGVDGVALDSDGAGVADPSDGAVRLLGTAHDDGLRAELLIHNYSSEIGDFDSTAAARLLRDDDHVRAVAQRLADIAVDQGWDGITVDLESLHRKDADGLVLLMSELQSRMPAAKTVTVDLMASTDLREFRARGYRLAAIAGVADVVAVMTYDQHGPGWSGPGPVGGLAWQRDVLDTLTSRVPVDQVDLGVAGYGYTWPKHGTGRTVTVPAARRLVQKDGAKAVWKRRAAEWTARLSNGTVLWWSDGRSFRKRQALAASYGVRGLALWRLGSTDTL
ncbi:hydrolase [Nocardioides sp. KIGAM211]|uniref:Hydrolase n=1 Tax=Nocardioides luti TaxID=2761101 RepID=A0A7X0VAJ3_9ACTN|nr:glycosyl hydrolase family 18 protein [Nocardioides luti]MBB6626188.1 hydrolase [Nocardioides luti]